MNITVLGCGRWGTFHAWYAHRIGHNVTLWGRPGSPHLGSLTPASEKKCHEASKMAYFFVKFYKFVSAISYYM